MALSKEEPHGEASQMVEPALLVAFTFCLMMLSGLSSASRGRRSRVEERHGEFTEIMKLVLGFA